MSKRALLWYRNDLRLHDHEPLIEATRECDSVLPVYVVDPRPFGRTYYGLEKTAGFRAQFIRESVEALRRSWQDTYDGQLLILHGRPEDLLPSLCQTHDIDAVYAYGEATYEEIFVERQVQQALHIPLHLYWGGTLLHIDDLPYPVSALPDGFTRFRKSCELEVYPRPSLTPPSDVDIIRCEDWGWFPTDEELGVSSLCPSTHAQTDFVGGEHRGIQRLRHYFWQTKCISRYKETRNGLLRSDDSSKFSPWLAHGCLSPRYIYAQLKQFEEEVVQNKSTYWLYFELLWRDFFRFRAVQLGNKIFHDTPHQRYSSPTARAWERFHLWKDAKTGIPFVDANMKELAETGFMSNRGRQNVASFLVKDLQVPWQLGAEYFESMLLDYDVCSNYGNWRYVAGVGADPRDNRYFNVLKQAQQYDAKGEYVRHWLPALQSLPGKSIHQPFFLSASLLDDAGINIGEDYPPPVVLPKAFHKYKLQEEPTLQMNMFGALR
ncbi:MAG TPA: cryptochrome DASH [Myxococcales bacterium]|nr:cryptochrome DASH [Deltaproteobacteria bacterium]MBU48574.1 cryptochrome DASH [Deltaproteobacteria bacterium]HAA59206.1 cryptochrome DASH [Myxococcales bacterium]